MSIKPNEPELTDVLLNFKLTLLRELNCAKIGSISSYDPATRTAKINILLKRKTATGVTIDYPVLLDVPVVTMQGGGAALQFPISSGDNCLVIFSDRNIDGWYETGSAQPPYTSRAHDIADGIAIVGLNSLVSNLPAGSNDETKLLYGDGFFSIKDDKVSLGNTTQDLLAAMIGFIDVLKSLSTVPGGGPLNAGSIAALEAQKAIFQGFLYS